MRAIPMNLRSILIAACLALLFIGSGCMKGGDRTAGSGSPGASDPARPPAASASDSSATSPSSPGSSALPSSQPPSRLLDPRTGLVTALRLADPQAGWAGGDGWVARTDDGGASWQVQYRGEGRVMQIFALNANEAWATLGTDSGHTLQLARTTDGGANWSNAGTAPGGAFLHFVSASEAFAGSARTTDGGMTWHELPIPDGTVGNAYFHDANNGWAVTEGTGKFAVRRTTDGGKTWTTVLDRASEVPPRDAIIRSAGEDDAWVALIGDSGMTQTSYSLLHTADGGRHWQAVLANDRAGSGPAPGFTMEEDEVPRNNGAAPGMLYVVSPEIAFMGGQCQACDNPNTIGKTVDGGKTWENLSGKYPGYGTQHIAAADAEHVWWITTDPVEPSKMYVTSDGGKSWNLVHSFDPPAR